MTYMVLNPDGNKGRGRITRYTGRGDGITARIELISILVEASRDAWAIVNRAVADNDDHADISGPTQVALVTREVLAEQANNN